MLTIVKGIGLLLLTLACFSVFSLKFPKKCCSPLPEKAALPLSGAQIRPSYDRGWVNSGMFGIRAIKGVAYPFKHAQMPSASILGASYFPSSPG